MSINTRQYSNIDIAKLIAAFLVMMVHCPVLESFGQTAELFFVSTLPRLGVPFFFACSGYFFFNKLTYENGKIKRNKSNLNVLLKYMKRIVLLYAIWSLIYLIWSLPKWYLTGWLSPFAFVDYAIGAFMKGSHYHLWYILNLIYGILFGYIILSLFKKNTVLILCIALYILNILTYSYDWIDISFIGYINAFSGKIGELWNSATRAFPLMFFAYSYSNYDKSKSKKLNLALAFVSSIGLVTEILLLHHFSDNEKMYSYIIFTVPLQLALFSLLLNSKQINISTDKATLFRNVSTFFYCVHPIILEALDFPVYREANSIIKYLIAAAIVLCVSVFMVKLSKKKRLRFIKVMF